jgi:iron complex transport system permease protein
MHGTLIDRMADEKLRRVTLALGAISLLLAAGSLFLGSTAIAPGDLVAGLFGAHGAAGIVAREIRLPRTILCLAVGAALGGSGAALQGLFRNPLAEPGVTGVTSAAGLGAVCALYFGLAAIHPFALPAMAILGALAAAGILFLMSRAGAGTAALILAGVAVSSLAAALIALALSMADNPYAVSEMALWLLGSVKDRTLNDCAYAVPLVGLGLVTLASAARGLDALALGEDAAASLGIDVAGVRARVVLGTALAVGAATAAAGAVGFVGLVAPHVLRPFCGYRPARLIWPSALGGAVLVTAADIGIRLIDSSGHLMLGAVTAMLGAPFFFWLIVKMRGRE